MDFESFFFSRWPLFGTQITSYFRVATFVAQIFMKKSMRAAHAKM